MASFKALEQNETIDNAYSGKVIIYLESEEDLQIIKERWFFDERAELEFKSVDTGEGGGCIQVIQKVENERKKGITAFGIVDRDILMKQGLWNLWWEVDDQQFEQAKPFGEYIIVLQRWELENYLLSPEELEMVMADKALRATKNINIVVQELLKKAEDLKILSAATMLLHQHGLSFDRGFGLNLSGPKLKKKLEDYLLNHLSFDDFEQLSVFIQRIEDFAQNHTMPTIQHWERLNRILDGKRTLQHLDLFKTRTGDRRGDLARHIRINNKIDPELKSYIEKFKKALQQSSVVKAK
jgi:hypothetical protein